MELRKERRRRGIRTGELLISYLSSKLGLDHESRYSNKKRFQGKKGHKILVGQEGNGSRMRR
jgi:hypothetical protein